MRIFPQELYIRRIKGDLPPGRAYEWVRGKTLEECVAALRKISGLDYGVDAELWEQWWKEEKQRLDLDPDF